MIRAMPEVVSISEAKTNLSKLVKRALDGETIYIGAYGTVQAVLGPAPVRKPIPIGVWAVRKAMDIDYAAPDLVGGVPEVTAEFEDSISREDTPEEIA